jgi:hypothetical protein
MASVNSEREQQGQRVENSVENSSTILLSEFKLRTMGFATFHGMP